MYCYIMVCGASMIWHVYEHFGMNLYVLVHAGIYFLIPWLGLTARVRVPVAPPDHKVCVAQKSKRAWGLALDAGDLINPKPGITVLSA